MVELELRCRLSGKFFGVCLSRVPDLELLPELPLCRDNCENVSARLLSRPFGLTYGTGK
jgi:hypothetical protein